MSCFSSTHEGEAVENPSDVESKGRAFDPRKVTEPICSLTSQWVNPCLTCSLRAKGNKAQSIIWGHTTILLPSVCLPGTQAYNLTWFQGTEGVRKDRPIWQQCWEHWLHLPKPALVDVGTEGQMPSLESSVSTSSVHGALSSAYSTKTVHGKNCGDQWLQQPVAHEPNFTQVSCPKEYMSGAPQP